MTGANDREPMTGANGRKTTCMQLTLAIPYLPRYYRSLIVPDGNAELEFLTTTIHPAIPDAHQTPDRMGLRQ